MVRDGLHERGLGYVKPLWIAVLFSLACLSVTPLPASVTPPNAGTTPSGYKATITAMVKKKETVQRTHPVSQLVDTLSFLAGLQVHQPPPPGTTSRVPSSSPPPPLNTPRASFPVACR